MSCFFKWIFSLEYRMNIDLTFVVFQAYRAKLSWKHLITWAKYLLLCEVRMKHLSSVPVTTHTVDYFSITAHPGVFLSYFSYMSVTSLTLYSNFYWSRSDTTKYLCILLHAKQLNASILITLLFSPHLSHLNPQDIKKTSTVKPVLSLWVYSWRNLCCWWRDILYPWTLLCFFSFCPPPPFLYPCLKIKATLHAFIFICSSRLYFFPKILSTAHQCWMNGLKWM